MISDAANPSHVVQPNELPVCCPKPSTALWNQHPRVYLPLKENGQATCPYCGCHYVLADASTSCHHD